MRELALTIKISSLPYAGSAYPVNTSDSLSNYGLIHNFYILLMPENIFNKASAASWDASSKIERQSL